MLFPPITKEIMMSFFIVLVIEFGLNMAPAICAVLMAPQVDQFRACSCAGVTSSPSAIT
jgi:hypothetical protein